MLVGAGYRSLGRLLAGGGDVTLRARGDGRGYSNAFDPEASWRGIARRVVVPPVVGVFVYENAPEAALGYAAQGSPGWGSCHRPDLQVEFSADHPQPPPPLSFQAFRQWNVSSNWCIPVPREQLDTQPQILGDDIQIR